MTTKVTIKNEGPDPVIVTTLVYGGRSSLTIPPTAGAGITVPVGETAEFTVHSHLALHVSEQPK